MAGFDLVMFDLDGTLVETAPEIMDAVNDALLVLDGDAVPVGVGDGDALEVLDGEAVAVGGADGDAVRVGVTGTPPCPFSVRAAHGSFVMLPHSFVLLPVRFRPSLHHAAAGVALRGVLTARVHAAEAGESGGGAGGGGEWSIALRGLVEAAQRPADSDPLPPP